jgi:hypothetical protein
VDCAPPPPAVGLTEGLGLREEDQLAEALAPGDRVAVGLPVPEELLLPVGLLLRLSEPDREALPEMLSELLALAPVEREAVGLAVPVAVPVPVPVPVELLVGVAEGVVEGVSSTGVLEGLEVREGKGTGELEKEGLLLGVAVKKKDRLRTLETTTSTPAPFTVLSEVKASSRAGPEEVPLMGVAAKLGLPEVLKSSGAVATAPSLTENTSGPLSVEKNSTLMKR